MRRLNYIHSYFFLAACIVGLGSCTNSKERILKHESEKLDKTWDQVSALITSLRNDTIYGIYLANNGDIYVEGFGIDRTNRIKAGSNVNTRIESYKENMKSLGVNRIRAFDEFVELSPDNSFLSGNCYHIRVYDHAAFGLSKKAGEYKLRDSVFLEFVGCSGTQ